VKNVSLQGYFVLMLFCAHTVDFTKFGHGYVIYTCLHVYHVTLASHCHISLLILVYILCQQCKIQRVDLTVQNIYGIHVQILRDAICKFLW